MCVYVGVMRKVSCWMRHIPYILQQHHRHTHTRALGGLPPPPPSGCCDDAMRDSLSLSLGVCVCVCVCVCRWLFCVCVYGLDVKIALRKHITVQQHTGLLKGGLRNVRQAFIPHTHTFTHSHTERKVTSFSIFVCRCVCGIIHPLRVLCLGK